MIAKASQISSLASCLEEYITVNWNKDTARRYLFWTLIVGPITVTYSFLREQEDSREKARSDGFGTRIAVTQYQ
jgi:hypothetical protein